MGSNIENKILICGRDCSCIEFVMEEGDVEGPLSYIIDFAEIEAI